MELAATLVAHLADRGSAWSIGTQGAIAEFFRDEDEATAPGDLVRRRVVTPRGAIALRLSRDVRPIAYEGLSRRSGDWTQGVVLCLAEPDATMARRSVITELGPDREALRPEDRDAVLFDLGLEIAHVDACVRTGDPGLLRELRLAAGRPLQGGDERVLRAIIAHHPHRVFASRIGRIEVFQPIPSLRTPEGPHTHFLPERLGAPDSRPLPPGLVACLELHPAHPRRDALGREKRFDADAHQRFQALLREWALPEYLDEKERAIRSLEAGTASGRYRAPRSALGRTALRVAIRQFAQTSRGRRAVNAWRAEFDR